ncbi:unnamed protein product [Trypanosoma congolense IL3000]|uniref:WGS project CAEQ00000000 data, annotated contig 738 n=1 Tax=Trypanosoma congolense (strain IL3000) TaxID=1068625 RepID=F9WI72_TRYCI|nr:unnamed protein product [Trypanosoma congolense IL3000]
MKVFSDAAACWGVISLKSSTVAAADAQGMREGVKTPLPQAPHTLLRVNVKLLQAQLVMRDGHDTPIHTTADRGELWVVYQSKKITAQCTASNVYSKGTYSGKLSHEIRPFSLDITVRDARVAAGTIHAFSIHAHVTTFEVQLSDTFVYQMQRLMRCLEGDSLPLEVDAAEIIGEVITPALSSEWRLLDTSLRVDFLLISEVLVIFSYDRSVQPPEDVVFQGSHIGNIFPSIHEAAITLPRVQCKDFRGTSVAEVWNVMCEGVTMELLKQMPQVVSGFVLLPTFSPIKNVIDRIGSFIFRGSGSSPNSQGPLLI